MLEGAKNIVEMCEKVNEVFCEKTKKGRSVRIKNLNTLY